MLRCSLLAVLALLPAALPAGSEEFRPPKIGVEEKAVSRIRQCIESGDWNGIGSIVRERSKKRSVSLNDLEQLAQTYPQTPFARAVTLTKKILFSKEKTGLSTRILLPAILFARTAMQNEVAGGRCFWGEHRFGRELQFDPDTGRFFIHLGTHGVKPIGIGRKKTVTKTICIEDDKFEMMARGVSQSGWNHEMEAMRHLKDTPGLIQAEALMVHKPSHGHKTLATIVTKIYRSGSLQKVIDTRSLKLTLSEKLLIASDIATGIAGMQSQGFVHRDLGAKNYFVDIQGKKPGHRTIKAVVADMGRTKPFAKAKDDPVQGNSNYLAPEGIFRSKMKRDDYCASDLFAVGSVFWQLYFGAMPPWAGAVSVKDESISAKKRFSAYARSIKFYRNCLAKGLKKYSSREKKFLRIILRLTDPRPSHRGSALDLERDLAALRPR